MGQNKKRNRIFYTVFLPMLVLCGILLFGIRAGAVSAAMNLTVSKEEIELYDTFSVVLTIESSEDVGDVDACISFDSDKLEFISGGAFVTGGDGVVLILDKDSGIESAEKKYTMKFKAKKNGEAGIWIETSSLYAALDGIKMSVSRNQLLLQIGRQNEEPAEDDSQKNASKDNSLKKLFVSPGTLEPEFAKDVRRYEITVEPDTKKLEIGTELSNKNAKVEIIGNTGLIAGENTVQIKVTAPSGDVSTTTIQVHKPAGTKKETDSDEEEGTSLEKVKIGISAEETEEGEICITEFTRITVTKIEDSSIVPKGYEKTSIIMDGFPVTAYTPAYDLTSDVLLLYGRNQEGMEGFYEYNRKEKTLVPYMVKSEGQAKSQQAAQTRSSSVTFTVIAIIAILTIICMALSVALILQKFRAKAKKDSQEEDDEFFF